MRLRVLSAYGCRFVGQGLTGYRKFGVPTGGPFDTFSYRLAVGLVGGGSGDVAIEIAHSTLTLLAEGPGVVSLVGGGHFIEVNGVNQPPRVRVAVASGSEVRVRPGGPGCRAYLAVLGGLTAREGGVPLASEALESGHVVSFHADCRLAQTPWPVECKSIRVVGLEKPFQATVTPHLNRVGIRLKTDAFALPTEEGESRPVVAGTIQLTPGDDVIVHGPDGPTVGGYHTLGVVATADLDALAQWCAGELVSFVPVDRDEARFALTIRRSEEDQVLNWLSASLR